MEDKLFIVFGVLALISGILLATQGQYLIGIPGAIVGLALIVKNTKKIREEQVK